MIWNGFWLRCSSSPSVDSFSIFVSSTASHLSKPTVQHFKISFQQKKKHLTNSNGVWSCVQKCHYGQSATNDSNWNWVNSQFLKFWPNYWKKKNKQLNEKSNTLVMRPNVLVFSISTPIFGQKSRNTRMAAKLVFSFVYFIYLHRTLTRMSRTSGWPTRLSAVHL